MSQLSSPFFSLFSDPDPYPNPAFQTREETPQFDDPLEGFFSFSIDWDPNSNSDYSGSGSGSGPQAQTFPFIDHIFGSPEDGSFQDVFMDALTDLSTLVDELPSGSLSESGRNERRGEGLRVAGLDSDSESGSDPDPRFFELDFPTILGGGGDGEENPVEEFGVLSSLSGSGFEEEDGIGVVRGMEWEVLLSVNNGFAEIEAIADDVMLAVEYDDDEGGGGVGRRMGGSLPAAKKVVENLPLVEGCGGAVVCAICKDEVAEEGEVLNRLPCCHCYHRECIVPWLRIRNTCPLCRYELPTDDEGYERRRRRRRRSGVSGGGELFAD